jgi:hypothetical protein
MLTSMLHTTTKRSPIFGFSRIVLNDSITEIIL